MSAKAFTLQPGTWYAWHLFPGYVDHMYYSAIHVTSVRRVKAGTGKLRVAYRDAGYAEGVQNFERSMRVLSRTAKLVVFAFADERVAVVSQITPEWVRHFFPALASRQKEDEDLQAFLTRALR